MDDVRALKPHEKVRIRNAWNTAWRPEPWFVFAQDETVAVYTSMDAPMLYLPRSQVTPWKEMCVQCETYLQTVGALCQECAKSRDQKTTVIGVDPAFGPDHSMEATYEGNRVVKVRRLPRHDPYAAHRQKLEAAGREINRPIVGRKYPYADANETWSTAQWES